MPPREILIVDDDYAFAEFSAMLLESIGCRATAALSGQRALELVAARRPDLILMDLNMPQMSGLETIRRLKADPATSGIPVVVCSSALESSDIEEARQAGAAACLRKPLGLAQLQEALDRALGPRP